MLTDECKPVKLHLLVHRLFVFEITKLVNDKQITQILLQLLFPHF